MPTTTAVIPPAEVRRQQEAAIRAATEAAEARNAAELAIVTEIATLAKKYNATQELATIEDVTIPALSRLAVQKNVSTEDWNNLITAITPLKWQLEALVGGTWAECWTGLKSRFPEYLQKLQQTPQEE
jgi:hypothetical protein